MTKTDARVSSIKLWHGAFSDLVLLLLRSPSVQTHYEIQNQIGVNDLLMELIKRLLTKPGKCSSLAFKVLGLTGKELCADLSDIEENSPCHI